MATNDFLAYADSGGANVISQATYAAASYIANGLGSGILASDIYNKMIRQGSIGAYLNGQIIVDYLGVDAADNSDLPTLLANFKAAIAAPSPWQLRNSSPGWCGGTPAPAISSSVSAPAPLRSGHRPCRASLPRFLPGPAEPGASGVCWCEQNLAAVRLK